MKKTVDSGWLVILLSCIIFLCSHSLFAWATVDGISVCTSTNSQMNPVIVADGVGGAIITWEDYRNDLVIPDIYIQRVDSSGTTLWITNGVAICTDFNTQLYPKLVSDGAGGAIITWQDDRSSVRDIYAQSINSAGAVPVELSQFEVMEGMKE